MANEATITKVLLFEFVVLPWAIYLRMTLNLFMKINGDVYIETSCLLIPYKIPHKFTFLIKGFYRAHIRKSIS